MSSGERLVHTQWHPQRITGGHGYQSPRLSSCLWNNDAYDKMHQRHKPGQPHLDDLRTTATGDAYNIQMIRTLCNEFNGYDLARCHGVAGPVGSCGSTVSTSTIAGPSWKLYDGYNVEYAPSHPIITPTATSYVDLMDLLTHFCNNNECVYGTLCLMFIDRAVASMAPPLQVSKLEPNCPPYLPSSSKPL